MAAVVLVLGVLGRRVLRVLVGCLGREVEGVVFVWACVRHMGSLASSSRASRGSCLDSVPCADEIWAHQRGAFCWSGGLNCRSDTRDTTRHRRGYSPNCDMRVLNHLFFVYPATEKASQCDRVPVLFELF